MSNNLNQDKLNSAAGTFGALIRAVPLGVKSILCLSAILQFLSTIFFNFNLGLKSNDWAIFNVPAFLFNQLINHSILYYIPAFILFPLAAAGLEQEVGSFQFLWLFQLLALFTSSLYIVVVNILSIVLPWSNDPVLGLDIAFMTFVTIEGLHGRGLYDIASRRGLLIAREFFFLPFFVFFLTLMLLVPPHISNIIPHILAVGVGAIYYLEMLKPFLLSDGVINALETSGMFQWYCQRPSFMIKPGAVQLPMPGAFTAADGSERASFLTQVEQAVRPEQDRYVQIGGTGTGPSLSSSSTSKPPGPLLWDENDENDNDSATLLKK